MSTNQEDHTAFLASLRQSEGYSDTPYKDTEGYWTVGWGHNLGMHAKKAEMRQYTRDELEDLFQSDIDHSNFEAQEVCVEWRLFPKQDVPGHIWYVLVEMCFVLGKHGTLGFHRFLTALKADDIPTAIAELRDSLWHHEAPHRVEKLCRRLESGTV